MLTYHCDHWDYKHECCLKHGIPQIPCPLCIEDREDSLRVVLSEKDAEYLDSEPEPLSLRDLLPATDSEWLVERIVHTRTR
jgi:hypothetical protein